MIQQRPPGCPPGVAMNPKGINQHANERSKTYGFRMLLTTEEKFLVRVEELGVTNTQAIQMAIEQWLEDQDK